MKRIFLNSSNKLRDIWWIAVFFIILLCLLLPTLLIAQANSLEVSIPVQGLIIIVATWLSQLLRRVSITEVTGEFNIKRIKEFGIGIGIGAFLMLIPAVILYGFNIVDYSVGVLSFDVLLNGFIICISVAITEEALFRGFIFQRLITSFGQWPTQIVIALLFLLTHSGGLSNAGEVKLLGSVNIFIASIMFGLAFIKTKGLALPIGIHFMANFVQGTILGFGVSGNSDPSIFKVKLADVPNWLHGGNFGLEASIFGLLVLILITIFVHKKIAVGNA